MNSSAARHSLDYWDAQLADVNSFLHLPTDYFRPKLFTNRAKSHSFALSSETTLRLTALARRLGVTENSVVLSLVQVLLGRFANQDSFSIGMPFSGRSNRIFEKTIGFFVNMLPITANLASNPSLEDVSIDVGRKLVDALTHERVPFAEIVRQVAPPRDGSHNPLFQVSCTFEKSQIKSEQGRAGFLSETIRARENLRA